MMSERNREPFSERCHALAKECRAKALTLHDDKKRASMLFLAEDYERKARQAAELESTLQGPLVEAPSLIPQIAEAFVARMKAENESRPRSSKKPRKRGTRRRNKKVAS